MPPQTKSAKRPASAAKTRKAKTNEKGAFESLVEKASNTVGNLMPSRRNNAVDLLKEDHDRVQELFDKVKSSDEKRHPALFERIKKELDVHTHLEETIFYPNLRAQGDKELVDIVLEGIEEHRQAKMFLKELDSLKKDSSKFEPKLKVLMEDVEHHVQEEESDMFPLVKRQFSADVLEDMAAEMEKEKRKFKRSLTAAAGH